jgi:hypothetical protein
VRIKQLLTYIKLFLIRRHWMIPETYIVINGEPFLLRSPTSPEEWQEVAAWEGKESVEAYKIRCRQIDPYVREKKE